MKKNKSNELAEEIRKLLTVNMAYFEKAKQFNGYYCFNMPVLHNLKKLNKKLEKAFEYVSDNTQNINE